MRSTTPTLRHTITIAIATVAIAFATAACSAPATTAGGSSNTGSTGAAGAAAATGSTAALCADSVGDAVSTGSGDSDTKVLLKTWDQMAIDAPSDIHSQVVAGDQAVQKLAKGDKSKDTQAAFIKHFGELADWVAKNCKQ